MIIALLLGLGAMIVSMLGLKCIKIGSSTDESKGKLAGTGGILAILGGEAPFFFPYNQQSIVPFSNQFRIEIFRRAIFTSFSKKILSIT